MSIRCRIGAKSGVYPKSSGKEIPTFLHSSDFSSSAPSLLYPLPPKVSLIPHLLLTMRDLGSHDISIEKNLTDCRMGIEQTRPLSHRLQGCITAEI